MRVPHTRTNCGPETILTAGTRCGAVASSSPAHSGTAEASAEAITPSRAARDWSETASTGKPVSSSTSAAGAFTGTGLAPRDLTRVIAVVKAYTTRVGEGPMHTEEPGETGERLRNAGGEFGATTGRPRRCGWLSWAPAP